MLLAQGRENDKAHVRQLQQGLAYFGFHPGAADGVFGLKTEEALEDWQTKAGVYPDGQFGPSSAKTWNDWCARKGVEHLQFDLRGSPTDPAEPPARLTWVKCSAKPMPNGHGFNSLWLRSDVAEAYKALDQEVTARGGYLTTAGGKRELDAKTSASRSTKSFHYTGRAFDLAIYSGLGGDPVDLPFLVVREGGTRRWNVWCKVTDPNAPKAAQVPVVTLPVSVCFHKRRANGTRFTQLSTVEWTGQAFSFTELAGIFGFQPISGRKSFFSGGSYGGAEWWHFQWEEGLTKGVSTFGDDLLKVYTLADCQRFAYWNEVKDAVFGVSWF